MRSLYTACMYGLQTPGVQGKTCDNCIVQVCNGVLQIHLVTPKAVHVQCTVNAQ